MKSNIADPKFSEKDLNRFKANIESWKRLLNSRMEENVVLKNMLSDILKNNYDQNLLDEIEEFQTRFICEDELINSLRKDVNILENLLSIRIFKDGKIEKSFESKMKNLQNDIPNSAGRFCILKSAFNDFQQKIFARPEKLATLKRVDLSRSND